MNNEIESVLVICSIALFELVYGSYVYAVAGLFGTLIAITFHLLFLLFYLVIYLIKYNQGGI